MATPLCSFAQETPLKTGAEQLAATTRRRLAMVRTHTHTNTAGGAQRDRQHPSWGRDEAAIRAPAEGGGGVMGER